MGKIHVKSLSPRTLFFSVWLVLIALGLGCAHILQHERSKEILKNDEYDQKIEVKSVESLPVLEVKPAPPEPPPAEETNGKRKKGKKKKGRKTVAEDKEKEKSKEEGKVTPAAPVPGPRQPDLEDTVGFEGRRPIVDPFRVGEKVTLSLTYFKIVAGTMDIEVKPFVMVNNQKAYQFQVSAKSNSFFNHIYAVDDTAITYVTYDQLVPLSLQISIKESKQLAEARTFFDWEKLKASYWQKRITKEHGEQSKKLDWDIKAFSQNVISAAFYLRCFHYEPGKSYAFRVADEGKNIVFKGEVLRREKLSTDIGDLDTLVIKPQLTVDGVFAPVGEILFWITDDERKYIVRIESKIKIGTIVAKLKSIN